MTKKIISVALILITLVGMVTINASAAPCGTGYYTVAGNSGSNVRSGAGSGYSVVGASSKGNTFYVSKTNGSWGYTSSIKCTNGTRSGWVHLDYCTYQGSGEHTHNYSGGRYYQKAHPHAISIRCTDYSNCGSKKYTGEYKKLDSCSECHPQTTYCTIYYSANGGKNAPSAQTVETNTYFSLSTKTPTRDGYKFLGWSINKNATSASYSSGQSVRLTNDVTFYAVWKEEKATSISLNCTSCTLNKGSTKQLTATVYPSNASDKTVEWSSNKILVATVSSSGKVTAKSPGVATIKAKTSNGKIKTCTVTVKGVKIGKSSIAIGFYKVGDVVTLPATAYPNNTTKFTWSSSDSSVVKVNSNGKITAKSAGSAIITAKTSDGRIGTYTISVLDVERWKTGNFDEGYTAMNYTTVTLNSGVDCGYMYIYAYDSWGLKTNAKMHITLRDDNGKWIWEGDITSGDKLKLGNDHKVYRVYIAKKQYEDNFIGQGDQFVNDGKCASWAINTKTNCYM